MSSLDIIEITSFRSLLRRRSSDVLDLLDVLEPRELRELGLLVVVILVAPCVSCSSSDSSLLNRVACCLDFRLAPAAAE